MSRIELPSMLAFDRKLETSDALMFSGIWEDAQNCEKWKKIPITKRYNRSTQSAHGIDEDNKSQPNPVSSGNDDANLPLDHDTLRVSFSVRIVGNLGVPFGCNSPEFTSAIQDQTEQFKNGDGIKTLAYRYAYNLANGRFLWRNRVGAEKIMIRITPSNDPDKEFQFNAYDFSLADFEKGQEDPDLQYLASIVEEYLKGDGESHVLLKVDAFAKLGFQQHVFPSQKMNMGEKEKVLFQLDECAAIHNVQIGNAIRTIDTWYPRYQEQGHPIAIEPFGAVTQIGEAFRRNKKEGDLYTLMVSWANLDELRLEDQMFIVGNLIRGGVFSRASK